MKFVNHRDFLAVPLEEDAALRAAIADGVGIEHGRALAAAVALTPLALTGIGVPTIALLVLSSALFGLALLLLRAFPRELLDLLPATGVLAPRGSRDRA